jgi:hypothetical protein
MRHISLAEKIISKRPSLFPGYIVSLPEEVVDALKEVREELDEHLDALNQNTSEIASVQEYVSEIDLKMEKLTERIDALQALLLAQTPASKNALRLNAKEQDVLQVLQGNAEPMTSTEIGKLCGLTPDMAAQTLYCLKQKGVHILAQTMNDQTYYALDLRFKIPN